MCENTKNLWDVALAVLATCGALIAFIVGLLQWRRGQAWQRANKLDEFIAKFESHELIQLAVAVLDWTSREVQFRGRDLTIRNEEALLALRDHREIKEKPEFPGEQALLRDAYDALLTFFERLEISISTGLIDAAPTKAYFAYWLKRLLHFDRHQDPDGLILKEVAPAAMVATYIRTYGDPAAIGRLAQRFNMTPPVDLRPAPGADGSSS